MSTRKLIQAVRQLSQQIGRLARSTPKKLMSWLLRGLLAIGRPRFAKAGFVLPTTILLLLVVSLTVGSISLRTFNRTSEAANERQQDVIYNAATPAIDRAKAKLEFLFDVNQDPRYPGGIPRENQLLGMMLNPPGGIEIEGLRVAEYRPDGNDPYTFPDERRLTYNGRVANVWTFPADTNGDGTNDATIAYSILMETPDDLKELQNSSPEAIAQRANALQVRNGPLSNTTQASSSCARGGSNRAESGWSPDPNAGNTIIRKNFQVDAFVLPNDVANTAVSTLEFFQDRKVNRGNKWGAWFRNDLEIFPGPAFNWNGAMHTEGSLIVGKPSPQDDRLVTSYLISAPASCLYSKSASEVTFGEFSDADLRSNPAANNGQVYYGHAISGGIGRGGAEDSNSFGGESLFHMHRGDGDAAPFIQRNQGVVFDEGTDSVVNEDRPTDYTLDPVVLLTEGVSKTRSEIQDSRIDPAWDGGSFKQNGRIFAQGETAPYVDDSYRADNRLGPKPQYKGVPIGGVIGANIDPSRGDLIQNTPPAGAGEGEVGLDGYWERRARAQGLRLIVGQRLELGNAFGWNFGQPPNGNELDNEPLRPWLRCSPNNDGKCNQARQRRSLYDNLAAVQATAVYHASSASSDNDTPLACLATTVHPGTAYTLERSATFENLRQYDLFGGSAFASAPSNISLINGDFFRGRGTNGWEYEAPNIAALRNPNSPLRLAMQNLARYAGDPKGGTPSFTPVTNDGAVHPYPSMAMWGDFSILRRILESGTSYDALSPADKTTMHTAACTLGMLAYNINYLLAYKPDQSALQTQLAPLIGAVFSGSSVAGVQTPPPFSTDSTRRLDSTATPEDVITALERWRDDARSIPGDFNRLNQAVYTAQMLATKEQVYSDLNYGFRSTRTYLPDSYCRAWEPSGSNPNPNLLRLCTKVPHYPILFSLFPTFDLSGRLSATPPSHGDADDDTRDVEDIRGANGRHRRYIRSVNFGTSTTVYRGISATDASGIAPVATSGLSQIQLAPKPRANWLLPTAPYAGSSTTPNNGTAQTGNGLNVLIRDCSSTALACIDAIYANPAAATNSDLVRVAFKDSAFMNGRELMGVRALDLDLDLMRTSSRGLSDDFWLPKSGIIYAFREDAVSESSIVRPAVSTWGACRTDTALENQPNCRMNTGSPTTDAYDSKDPPLNSTNLITPKPVDYYADPDRRPNGFRLRDGIQIDRSGDQGRGMTFVSDNPVYIQGDFNWHQTSDGRLLEEFRERLLDNYSNFYQRREPELAFANSAPTGDLWRPAEILADAITILSRNFCDGSIQDGIITATRTTIPAAANPERYGCLNGVAVTSYFNQGRPNSPVPPVAPANNSWRRASKAESDDYREQESGRTPIVVNRYGNPIVYSNTAFGDPYNGDFDGVEVDKLRNVAVETRVNATIVSGIVPSRQDQSYGGLHNFPRFLESWQISDASQIPLRIAGSFIQLNFSNYATAPFDQDAFEVGTRPIGGSSGGELINYYRPPNRFWGYDVGLQYAPAGPLAQRFITLEPVRSEFYSEPPADDPYLRNLCRAAATAAASSPGGQGRTIANSCPS
ncbi:hypothetical protein H6F67_16095 [Microcoleus sp. FACHB-1515]|uniref:hormogonium polysaccharide biosynthesis protein HpsA n=1 Tax=Cyanophyceae TaxID=3028117 RepID=UPI001682CC84|nr:hormogonium polysaccharide biosynthesis protein HpsA [Microcoleus sp. FACHB-1515]MBD2091369.1 hypothetical protein [Microcoleus sp. FACHB-1515]